MRTPLRVGPGPVFVHEAIGAARRWSFFALRSLFVLGLLAGLGLVWLEFGGLAGRGMVSIEALAELGEYFYYAIATIQLTLVLLVAPVATADAICLDRARGNLTHMLVTDLSSAEIVIGRLAARLLTVLALVGATIPVLALAGLLGGVILEAIVTLTLTTLGLALLGCSLALAISVGARKTHEVLMAVYAIESVWILGPFVWSFFEDRGGGILRIPQWYWNINPYVLVLAPYLWPNTLSRGQLAAVVGGMLAISAVLVFWAVLRIRAAESQRDGLRGARGPRRLARAAQWLTAWRRRPTLDDNPVLWREWRRGRPSRPAQVVWGLFIALALAGTARGVVLIWDDDQSGIELMALVNALQATLALLLVSIAAPTVLAEERMRGSLDVLLTSPLGTERIVLAKWWGAYRAVPALALLPAIGGLWIALAAPDPQFSSLAQGRLHNPPTTLDRFLIATFPVALFLAQGAVVVSFGLALATWIRRVGRAVALSVAGYACAALGSVVLMATGILPDLLAALGWADLHHPETEEFLEKLSLTVSPLGGQVLPIASALGSTVPARYADYLMLLIMLLATLGLALLLLGLTLATFDRSVGRVPERPRRVPRPPPGTTGQSAMGLEVRARFRRYSKVFARPKAIDQRSGRPVTWQQSLSLALRARSSTQDWSSPECPGPTTKPCSASSASAGSS
jgi:ABC-type transport system involved in multi-copper enzyme maturation permease subunit